MPAEVSLSTGLPGLDQVFRGVVAGDNVVWQVESIEEYEAFVKPYCDNVLRSGGNVTYFRFAEHRPLVEKSSGVEICDLEPRDGFEPFIARVHKIIEAAGPRASYVFDCLSELAADWCSDRMLGNLFMLTCPYVYDRGGVAYFSFFKNQHSFHATDPIMKTAQIVVDVRRHKGKLYLRPLKVEHRHSDTMHMLHVWEDSGFIPVAESRTNTEILGDVPWNRMEDASYRLGWWTSTFRRAEELKAAYERGEQMREGADALVGQLQRMMIGAEGRTLELALRYFGLSDFVRIRRRMIGTGPIGGKSVGMLLGRAVLEKTDACWASLLEPHDSFFIGAEVFYTYLVQNGLWWIKQKQKDPEEFLSGAELARHQMLNGTFPDYIVQRFTDLLEYFGPSPIVVRSSSLLEDSFESAFAGKSKSVFCINQGSRDERLDDFISAVRTVYASTMSEDALKYRWAHGLLDRDERMAVLVQRVSGALHGRLYFPHIAGVGLSFNPYVWSERIDPAAGVLRLVFGLGTRAVNTAEGDYTRMVALSAPELQTEDAFHRKRKYVQRKVDVLDLELQSCVSFDFGDVAGQCQGLPLEIFASRNAELERFADERKLKDVFPWCLTFDKLLRETTFVDRMREMLRILQEAYQSPVDVEFTANFCGDGTYSVNLVQCRPMRVKCDGITTDLPVEFSEGDRILESRGPVVGRSCDVAVDRLIYVVPGAYGELSVRDRYTIAKLIGQVAGRGEAAENRRTMLVGPGRWGTSTPSLGIPISFAEIKTAGVVCEIVAMREGLIPDVSLGTHFFNELVEADMLYFALFPGREGDFLNSSLLENAPNRLPGLLPGAAKWADVVRVLDPLEWGDGKLLRLNASAVKQRVICYRKVGEVETPR